MPSFEDIQLPNWATWLAQDENGSWWAFSIEPLEHSSGWYENEVGQYTFIKKSACNSSWKETLTKIIF